MSAAALGTRIACHTRPSAPALDPITGHKMGKEGEKKKEKKWRKLGKAIRVRLGLEGMSRCMRHNSNAARGPRLDKHPKQQQGHNSIINWGQPNKTL